MERYQAEQKQLPKRVVIHKTSRFEPQERSGFEGALKKRGCLYDLVSLTPTSSARLLRAGQYPPLRGTLFSVGAISYLYTTGYLPALGKYPHGHVPSPLQVADHVGDTAKADLLREVMVADQDELELGEHGRFDADHAAILPAGRRRAAGSARRPGTAAEVQVLYVTEDNRRHRQRPSLTLDLCSASVRQLWVLPSKGSCFKFCLGSLTCLFQPHKCKAIANYEIESYWHWAVARNNSGWISKSLSPGQHTSGDYSRRSWGWLIYEMAV